MESPFDRRSLAVNWKLLKRDALKVARVGMSDCIRKLNILDRKS